MSVFKCSHKGCNAGFKNHVWGSIRAHGDGWFEMKNGQHYCPQHVPEWVAGWREKGKDNVAPPTGTTA